jgi:hypothetical protein
METSGSTEALISTGIFPGLQWIFLRNRPLVYIEIPLLLEKNWGISSTIAVIMSALNSVQV